MLPVPRSQSPFSRRCWLACVAGISGFWQKLEFKNFSHGCSGLLLVLPLSTTLITARREATLRAAARAAERQQTPEEASQQPNQWRPFEILEQVGRRCHGVFPPCCLQPSACQVARLSLATLTGRKVARNTWLDKPPSLLSSLLPLLCTQYFGAAGRTVNFNFSEHALSLRGRFWIERRAEEEICKHGNCSLACKQDSWTNMSNTNSWGWEQVDTFGKMSLDGGGRVLSQRIKREI